jgi:hypothetical protein
MPAESSDTGGTGVVEGASGACQAASKHGVSAGCDEGKKGIGRGETLTTDFTDVHRFSKVDVTILVRRRRSVTYRK